MTSVIGRVMAKIAVNTHIRVGLLLKIQRLFRSEVSNNNNDSKGNTAKWILKWFSRIYPVQKTTVHTLGSS